MENDSISAEIAFLQSPLGFLLCIASLLVIGTVHEAYGRMDEGEQVSDEAIPVS
jgi:hypothetical protein